MEDYNNDEFAMAKVIFLSTNKNSHNIEISEEVLRENAKSVLGKWLVAEYDDFYQDVTTHTENQQIFGMFPVNQEVEFEQDGDVVKASAIAIISKVYSTKLYNLFTDEDTKKDVSVEMIYGGDEHDDGSITATDFNIVGVTVLGKALGRDVHGSCPDACMNMVRFSEEDANKFYVNFEERRENMAEKTYKINKDELKETAWGDVDKTELRNVIMEADNKAELVKFVYMLVEDGWEDAPSEHLKYPVAELDGDTFYYNRYGLASALAYAKKEDEDEVVEKIEKIYDKFDLDKEEKEDMAMKEIEFATESLEPEKTEVELASTEEVEKCELEEKPGNTDNDINNKDDDKDDDDIDDNDELAKALAKCEELERLLKEKDNIIMEKDACIAELEAYKADIENKEKLAQVETVMEEVNEYLDNDKYKEFKDEGILCELSALENWTNKVKAYCFAQMSADQSTKPFRYTNFSVNVNTEGNVWDRL